jgi:hypothetical protein
MKPEDTMNTLMAVVYIAYFYAFVKLTRESDVPTGLLIIPLFLIAISQFITDKALVRYSTILMLLAIAIQFKALYDIDRLTSIMMLPYLVILLLILFKVKLPLQ